MTAGPVTASESAVLVPFPEAERVVSPYRARLDGAAALGVPAHVTVLYPFVPPPATGGVAELRAAEAAVRPQLPIRAQVSRVWLMTGRPSPGSWRTVAELPLAEPRPTEPRPTELGRPSFGRPPGRTRLAFPRNAAIPAASAYTTCSCFNRTDYRGQ